MSYRIEYQWACFRETDSQGDRYVVAVEGGDNNLWNGTKRARSWSVCMLGSEAQVLRRAVYFAGACEGGSLKPGGRNCTPEGYIRRIRRLLSASATGLPTGRWYPAVELDPKHPAVNFLTGRGCACHEGVRFGRAVASFALAETQRSLIFDLADAFPKLMAWDLAKVAGLPTS